MPGSDDYDKKVSGQITENLKMGDAETGEGGSSFKEVIRNTQNINISQFMGMVNQSRRCL